MTKESSKPAARRGAKANPADPPPDFEGLLNHAPYGVLVHRNFRPLYANRTLARLLGYKSPAQILELPILRPLFQADQWPQVEDDYDAVITERQSIVSHRLTLHRKNGKEISVTGAQSRVMWKDEPAVQLSVHDSTAQMELEQSLLRSEQHLRAVLEILPYPIYIAQQSDGRLLFVNRKTCLLFQRSASALLRGTSVDFFANPNERDDLRKLLEKMQDIRDIEVNMKMSSGQEFIAEFSAIRMEYNSEPAILVALNDISDRKALEAELMQQASTDSLTGICNRRYFIAQAEQEMRRSKRFSRPVSVMMMDLDHFKAVNDRHGHNVGDIVLQSVVRRAQESLRQSDVLARFGGEEFVTLLPETGLTAAAEVAERLRQHVEERTIIAGGVAVPCTISIGVAEMKPSDSSIDSLLHRADEALYSAKGKGRNRVEQAT